MFLKLRVPFFASFDKRALRLVIDRVSISFLRRDQVLTQYGRTAEHLYTVISGQLAEYEATHAVAVKESTEPDATIEPYSTFGEECMATAIKWPSTITAMKKSVVVSLHKKDLVEVLEHVKVIN